jgi:hypothetical protein
MLRRRFFQPIAVLSGITLLPILSMILRSTDAQRRACEWFEFLDFKSNTDNFLDYFLLRNATCMPCMRVSVTTFNPLVNLMNESVIFASCCLGWGLGAGVANQKTTFPDRLPPNRERLDVLSQMQWRTHWR